MQAITTKYLCPTNYRGSRIKATSSSGLSVTVSYDHASAHYSSHVTALKALCNKLGWRARWRCGEMPNGYVWVAEMKNSEGTVRI